MSDTHYILLPLGEGKFTKVDSDVPPGILGHSWSCSGGREKQYATRGKGRAKIYLHREILNTDSGAEGDHKDRDRLNNLRSNLRPCSRSQNHANVGKQRGVYTSTFKGVSFCGQTGLWRASIKVRGRAITLGRFVSEIRAAQRYDKKAIQYFGRFAGLNFPKL